MDVHEAQGFLHKINSEQISEQGDLMSLPKYKLKYFSDKPAVLCCL